MKLVFIMIMGMLCFGGIISIVYSINLKHKANYLIKKCKNKCKGILKEINEIEIDHSDISKNYYHTTKSYIPIYEYEIQGKKYKIKGTNGSGFKIGDIVEINYNRENPEECYIEDYSFIFWKMFLIFGIICLITFLVFIFLIKLIF